MSAEDQIKAMMEARDRERRAVDLMRLRIEGERDRLARALVESEKRVKAVLEAAETEWLNGNMEESAFDRIEARAALLEGEPDAR